MVEAPRLLQNRDFMLLWGGQVVSTLGSMASHVIFPLLILAITDSPTAAGIAGALRFMPYLVLSLPVGALIDRWDRKRVMVVSDLGRALAVGSIPAAMALDSLTLAHIYIVCFVEGSLFVFFNIAEVAALPRVVPRAQLPEATAYNEAGFGVANIVGPSMGTILYQTLGRAVPFIVDTLTYLVSLASLLAMKTEFQRESAPAKRDLREEIAAGLRWLWSKLLIRFMAFLTGGINFVNGGTALILIVMAKELGAQPVDIGLIFSIGGIGGIVGSLLGGQIQRRFSFGQVIVGVTWALALLFPLYLVVPRFVLLGVVSALTYMTGPIYNVVQFSYRLALIPDSLQGRVNSTFRLLAFGFIPVGAAAGGFLLERIGSTATVGVFAAVYLLMAIATTFNGHVREAQPLAEITAAPESG
jgi:predicted MFS family arabinose efflux permease